MTRNKVVVVVRQRKTRPRNKVVVVVRQRKTRLRNKVVVVVRQRKARLRKTKLQPLAAHCGVRLVRNLLTPKPVHLPHANFPPQAICLKVMTAATSSRSWARVLRLLAWV
jgi:hypothetical protein